MTCKEIMDKIICFARLKKLKIEFIFSREGQKDACSHRVC